MNERNDRLERAIREWTRLGAAFSTLPARKCPDLERLLLETARLAPSMPRLFIMATSWLNKYGDSVAKSRLIWLIHQELEPEHQAALGLMLEVAQGGTHPARFASVIQELAVARHRRPLFEVERTPASMAARARRRASKASLRWGVWCEPFELKHDALRPANWVMARNPELVARADFRGDLRASALAALAHDPSAGDSEIHLARHSGGSRAQLRNALDNLELTGKVRRIRRQGVRRTQICLPA